MKDLHTHILYNVDDGPKTIEESIDILRQAALNNVTDIILTPHYIVDSKFTVNNHQKEILFQKLKRELIARKININIYLGNEVYIDELIPNLIKTDITTLNNSRYLLIELPLNTKYPALIEVIIKLKEFNLIPIIAHPERYRKYYQDYKFFDRLIEMGCLFQGNIGSLYGLYGIKSKWMLRGMLKRNQIHFLASDIHNTKSKIYHQNFTKDLLKIVKDKKIVENLTINNIDKVLNDDIIK